jgi:hypothetical protein
MIIVLKPEAPADSAERLLKKIEDAGLKPLHMPGAERVVLGALGDERVLAELALDSDPAVESVKPVLAPYKLVSRELQAHDTVVDVGGVSIGGDRLAVIAGPCAVESPSSCTRRRRGEGGGRDPAARRRLQAAHQPLRLLRPRPEGSASCAKSATTLACRSSPR